MGCVEDLGYDVLLSMASFKECREYVEKQYKEIYYVDPGFKLFEKRIIGVPPIAIALDGETVILPYTKPCHGTYLLRVVSADEAAVVRSKARRR
ncbi:DUF1894 domain-containing protein, partial [Methanocalculus sp.]|uniref:DUF1894 domain-containing protein n=1 Tax=Methanocalculus sp. TaxID=2004547 RepID=UPI002721AB55